MRDTECMKTLDIATARRTHVAVSAVAQCSFSIAEDYATEYLSSAANGSTAAAIRLPWRLPLPALEHRVAMTFGLHYDVLEGGRTHDEVRIRWHSGSFVLPEFRGTLRFRINGTRTTVLVDGSYIAPAGVLGQLFDRLIGRHIAHASLTDFTTRLAAYLGERERLWRASFVDRPERAQAVG
jgi:hypothetical protein